MCKLFTNVYQQAMQAIPLGGAVGALAYQEAGFAQMAGNILVSTYGRCIGRSAPPISSPSIGPASPAQSFVSLSPTTVAVGGTSTVTLIAVDANGNLLTTGGATVTFGLGNGTAQGTFSTVTDNSDGSYTATFTATAAGTNTILGSINGQALTSTAPTITVSISAAPDPTQSTVTASPTSFAIGGTSTVTLTAKDSNGNGLTVGGATVTFGLGAGTATGSFGPVTDNGDGTYSATLTGTGAGTNTITATLNAQTVTTTPPAITITPAGTADPAQSTVALSPTSIATGGTSTVTLTARDANGNALTAGGSTVTFGLGIGAAQGNFSVVTDNGNGTYTATFIGTTAGTNTVTATIDGQSLTSVAPTITVVGPADPAQSVTSVSPASIQVGGTSTVTLTANDANGNQLATGGSTVVFGLGNGVGQGTFSIVTDNGDGTYSATFTGTTAGTNSITTTLDGQTITSAAPTITVVGAADPAQSTVSTTPATIQSGNTSTVTFTAKDANGNQLTVGGSTIVFSLGAGIGQGTFGAVTDNGDGTYSSIFTGTTVGANTIAATLDGQTVTTTAPTITIVDAADPAQSIVSLAPISIPIGTTSTVTLTTNDASGNPVTIGGSTVVFSLGNGVAQGTFGTVIDNGDGTYTADFTGTTQGTNTVTATINGQAVTTAAPTITVTPPAADPAQSTISLSPSSIQIGGASTVTLTAIDSSGTPLTTGGATVTFAVGTGTAQGTFSIVTDNGDGTYTATFTGTVAGDSTIAATIDGQDVTSSLPRITVVGAADPAQSVVAVAPATIANGGTSTVTLTAKDANGNQLTIGGSTVVFGLGNGTAQGTFDTVADNGDGTYTSIFTGTAAGTNTITATLDAQAVTTTAPTITVTSTAADPAQSTVDVSPASIASGGTATVTLTAKDASGNPLTTGGSIVTFGLGNGVAQGTFSTVTDNGDGTYTATFTGSTVGTNTITATIDGQTVTSTAPTITVTAGAGAADPTQSTVAVAPGTIATGGTSTVTLTAKDSSGTPLTVGGSTVTFALGTGDALGTFSSVTDNGDGTYTATFTATAPGSNIITATLDGQAVTTSPPTIIVNTPGPADPTQSIVTVLPSTIATGNTATVTLTAKDVNGNTLTTGGATVTFGLGTGDAQGSFSIVTDNGDGTYTATFTGSGAGVNTITATLNGQTVTTTAPTINVT